MNLLFDRSRIIEIYGIVIAAPGEVVVRAVIYRIGKLRLSFTLLLLGLQEMATQYQ